MEPNEDIAGKLGRYAFFRTLRRNKRMTAPTVALKQLADRAAGAYAELTEEEPADERADHADDHVGEPSEAASLHQQPGEPAGQKADQ